MQTKSITKRIPSLILLSILIITISTAFTTNILAADVTLSTNTRADLQAEINNAGSALTTIIITESFSFDENAITIPAGANITLRSEGDSSYKLFQSNTNIRHFIVNGKLTLADINLDGSSIGGGVRVNSGGSLTLESGVIIQNCYFNPGGGVYNNSGTIIMKRGAVIQDCTTNTANNGGGVYMAGGVFTMEDGAVIQKCSAGSGGGGVFLSGGTFNMSGGTINGNMTTTFNSWTIIGGGGVFVSGGTFNMTSGSIMDNLVNGANHGGGGIGLSGGSFNMSGDATIRGNSTPAVNTSGGGGIYVYNNGTIKLKDNVKITGNTSQYGGGVRVNSVTANNISGNVKISDNTAKFHGGGVYVMGNFSMTDGFISSNTVTYPGDYDGGGVYVTGSSSVVTMNNVTIGGSNGGDSNTAKSGGGVYVNSGTFIMNGGSISGNGKEKTIDGTTYESSTSGGGVYVNNGIFEMRSGAISGNTASTNGGGVYAAANGMVKITDGTGPSTIARNSARNGHGGGIYTADANYANLTTASSTVFSDNIATTAHTPPYNAVTLYPAIGYTNVSISDHPLNNYDINYTSGAGIFYHITYDANGGEGSYIGPDIRPGGTDKVLSPAATNISRAEYTFTGWNSRVNGSGESYAPNDEIILYNNDTFYAQWSINYYTITFDSNEGSGVQSQTVSYGEKVTRPATPSRNGYTFAGWYTDNNTFINAWEFNTDTITENMTLYAKWSRNDSAIIHSSGPGSTAESQTESEEITTDQITSTELTESKESAESNVPKTGDDNDMVLWMNMFFISLATIGLILLIFNWGEKDKEN